MRKKILLLFPYKFTEFEYYKFEISKLEKKYNFKIVINDLSNILNNKKLNLAWTSKRYQKVLFFRSITEWIHFFNKIKKKNIIIFNFVNNCYNFNSFIIKLYIKLSKKPVFLFQEASIDSIIKKNTSWLLSNIYHHKFNFRVYLFYLNYYFFYFLMSFFKYKKYFTLFSDYRKNINIKKNLIININQHDYSNSLLFTNNNNNNNKKKKYIIYLDSPSPYFTGDTHLIGNKLPEWDTKGWYKDLLHFFDKLENYFDADVIIIPHPKHKSLNKKIKSHNPYFKNRIVNNDSTSLGKLSTNAFFFISRGSTAVAYAVAHNKPVVCISSSNYAYEKNEIKGLLYQAKLLGCKPFDISKLHINEIRKFLKINKSKYCNYKYTYLTTKKGKIEKTPNYKIIGDFISKHI